MPADQVAELVSSNPQPPAEIAKRIKELITQLGAASFEDRETASKELIKMGPKIAPMLKAANPDDAEARTRIRSILEAIGESPSIHG